MSLALGTERAERGPAEPNGAEAARCRGSDGANAHSPAAGQLKPADSQPQRLPIPDAIELACRSPRRRYQPPRAEIVFAPLYYNQMVFVAREAKRQKLPMTTFVGGDGWAGDAAALAELEGAHYIDHWAVDLPTPASRTFVEAYQKEFGEPPQSIAATSYDAILVLADAINRASSLAGKDVRDAIATTKDLPTVTGPITIDAEHNAQKPLIAVQVRNKTAHFVAAVGPGSQAVNAYKVVSP